VALHAPWRVFVSWHHSGGELVGCIGTLSASSTLLEAVTRYALAAADDPRTPPLTAEHVDDLRLDISLLGDPHRLEAVGFDAIAGVLRPHEEGVTLFDRTHRSAFFLPVVWDVFPEPRDFLRALARKAGIDLVLESAHLRAETMPVFAFGDAGD
jgi:AmmeMemoRadiSam system protein A